MMQASIINGLLRQLLPIQPAILSEATWGITVVDPFTAANFKDPLVVSRPLFPMIPFECSYVLPSHQHRPKAVEDFIHKVKEHFEAV